MRDYLGASSRSTTMSGGSGPPGRQGLARNTLVVYTSDQGFFLGDHGWFDKRLMFDQSLQMPMLMRWPADIAPGSRCDAIITNVDFAATFLDVAGIDTAAALPTSQGRSFRPLLRGESGRRLARRGVLPLLGARRPDPSRPAHYGVRTADHKLIHYYGAGLGVPGASDKVFDPEWELYDLRKDPSELHNVADDPPMGGCTPRSGTRWRTSAGPNRDEPYVGPVRPPRGDDTTRRSSSSLPGTWQVSRPPAPDGGAVGGRQPAPHRPIPHAGSRPHRRLRPSHREEPRP